MKRYRDAAGRKQTGNICLIPRRFKEETTMEYTVRQPPSGFWAVFAGDEWIDAAQPTQEAALAFAGRLKGEVAPA